MKKITGNFFLIQQHESFIDHFFLTFRGHSSAQIQNTTIVSFLSVFFTLMGILLVFMGNVTINIFCQCCFHMRILRIYACYLEHCLIGQQKIG